MADSRPIDNDFYANIDPELSDLLGQYQGEVSILDRPLLVSAFADLHAKSVTAKPYSLRQLSERLGKKIASKKHGLPLFKLAKFGKEPTVKGSLRHDANVRSINGIEVDYDAGEVPFETAIKRLRSAGLAFLAYTSPSHTAAAPRWRVVCPTSKELPASERAALVDRLNGVGCLNGILARESWTLSQAFYWGRVEGATFESHLEDGLPIDLADLEFGAKPFENNRELDNSRSGIAYRLACELKRAAKSIETFKTALESDPELQAWAKDKRQVQRTWERASATIDLSGDVQAGDAFAARYKGQFLHIYSQNHWLNFDGTRWEKSSGAHLEAGKALAREALGLAASEMTRTAGDDDQTAHKAAKAAYGDAKARLKDSGRLKSMIDMARSVPGIVCEPDSFDTDPYVLGVMNGVLDLQSGTLIPPAPEQLITKQAGSAFDSNAKAPKFLSFLEQVQPDPAIREFLQRAVGYTLSGSVNQELFFFCYGVGANGKSTFANIVSKVMGDYSVDVGARLLAKTKGADSERDRLITRLQGARLALANETGTGDVWDDSLLKTITSNERIPARKLYGEAYDFMPTHKLWIRGNHLPGAHDAGDAFWRRIVPIAWPIQIKAESCDPDLASKIIETELPGVLAWAIEGCRKWQANGNLLLPQSIKDARASYRADTDVLGTWLRERTIQKPLSRLPARSAYQSYRHHLIDNGHSAPSETTFGRQMGSRGLEKVRTKSGFIYEHLALVDGFEAYLEDSQKDSKQ
jgi:putative DNA primase/helicase